MNADRLTEQFGRVEPAHTEARLPDSPAFLAFLAGGCLMPQPSFLAGGHLMPQPSPGRALAGLPAQVEQAGQTKA